MLSKSFSGFVLGFSLLTCYTLQGQEQQCSQFNESECTDWHVDDEEVPCESCHCHIGLFYTDDDNPVQDFDDETSWPSSREDSFYDELTR